jgi:RNA polymerase sigma factor (sigma-70 family)
VTQFDPVVQSSVKGPDDAFVQLFAARYEAMVMVARVTTASTPVAEELVQDAFLDVYRCFAQLDNPDAYLRRAVMSRCTSWVRRRVVERNHRDAPAVVPRSWSDPDTFTTMDAISRLPTRQRAVVVMRYFADWSENDMADALGCRPGTVKSLLARARSTLAKELSDDT